MSLVARGEVRDAGFLTSAVCYLKECGILEDKSSWITACERILGATSSSDRFLAKAVTRLIPHVVTACRYQNPKSLARACPYPRVLALHSSTQLSLTSGKTFAFSRETEEESCFCGEEYQEYSRLYCGHVFHRRCLETWIGVRTASCPVCRWEGVNFVKELLDAHLEDGPTFSMGYFLEVPRRAKRRRSGMS
ncbi:unnamed protein product [Chrysoparadoxa australica]